MLPGSRAEALLIGSSRYQTGRPCPHGHLSPRQTSNGCCVVCQQDRAKRWDETRPGERSKRQIEIIKAGLRKPKQKSAVFAQPRLPRPNPRAEAKARGEDRYIPSKPCRRGHRERYVQDGSCILCRSLHGPDRSVRRAYEKQWRDANPERVRERKNKWRAEHPDRVQALRYNAYHRDIEKGRTRSRIHNAIRRARLAGSGGRFSRADIQTLFTRQNGKCAECKKQMKDIHIDHITPIAAGGVNTMTNLQLLCPKCNLQKGKLDPIDWARKRGRLL